MSLSTMLQYFTLNLDLYALHLLIKVNFPTKVAPIKLLLWNTLTLYVTYKNCEKELLILFFLLDLKIK